MNVKRLPWHFGNSRLLIRSKSGQPVSFIVIHKSGIVSWCIILQCVGSRNERNCRNGISAGKKAFTQWTGDQHRVLNLICVTNSDVSFTLSFFPDVF